MRSGRSCRRWPWRPWAGTDFFKHALFQGGDCLRIFYGLNRFSEDMDFILKEPNGDFELQPHLQPASDELKAYGYDIEIVDRSKAVAAARKAFLKDDSLGKVLQWQYVDKSGPSRKIRVKFEIDTTPPIRQWDGNQVCGFPFCLFCYCAG